MRQRSLSAPDLQAVTDLRDTQGLFNTPSSLEQAFDALENSWSFGTFRSLATNAGAWPGPINIADLTWTADPASDATASSSEVCSPACQTDQAKLDVLPFRIHGTAQTESKAAGFIEAITPGSGVHDRSDFAPLDEDGAEQSMNGGTVF